MEDDIFSDLIGQAGFKPLTKQAQAQAQPRISAEQATVAALPAKAQITGHVGPREPVLPEPDLLDSALPGPEANGTPQPPQLGMNLSKEDLQTLVQQIVETALDSTMSKFVRSLRTVLEDMGRRIEATGSACIELRDTVEQFKDHLESQGSSMHARFTNVDMAIKEVERGVQSLRDKQELLEAQAMLAKLSTKPVADSPADSAAHKQPETPAAAAAAPAATSAPAASAPPAAAAAPAPPVAAPAVPAAPQPVGSSYAAGVPQAPAAPPPPAPAAPPAVAAGVPAAPAAPYAPMAPPGAPPPPLQQQQPHQQFAPPPSMPYTSQGISAAPAPPAQPMAPPPMYQQQAHAPPQQSSSSYMSGPPSYGQQGPPPGAPGPHMPAGPPAAMYGPPPGAAGPQYPAPPAGAYPAPFRTGSGQLPHQSGPPAGGRPGAPQQQGAPAIQQLSLDKVVADIVAMGFSHGQVMNVIRQLQSSGQPLEMNVIIDRCMR